MQKQKNNKVLIEIGAQHPLVDGKPGIEFEKRLLKGIELYNDEIKKGNKPVIYIPGSLHSIKKDGEWVTDKNSLSTAGKNFLLEKGIPEECIRSDETNEKYKTDGVYNSGDECLVAKLIADDEEIDRIISVVSPIQIDRKALFYIRYGYYPEMYGVGLENTYHNYPGEAFWSLYITYFIDHTWQNSFLAVKTRLERDFNYKITREIQELIDAGIIIPEDVLKRKEEFMSLYKGTQESIYKKSENDGIVISVEFNENDDDELKYEKIKETLKICEQNRDKLNQIKIHIIGIDDKLVLSIFQDELGKNVEIDTIESFLKEVKKYQDTKCGKWFHVTDSQKVMNEAMISIKQGALPVIFSIPNKDISYIDQIEKLYSDILRINTKDKIVSEEYNDGENSNEEK